MFARHIIKLPDADVTRLLIEPALIRSAGSRVVSRIVTAKTLFARSPLPAERKAFRITREPGWITPKHVRGI
jgi:hypothetical protein